MDDEKDWCRHYNGVGNGPVCKAGVLYETVKDVIPDGHPSWTYPYYNPKAQTICAKREYYTDAELAEHEKAVVAFIDSMTAFTDRKTEDCIHCGKHVTKLRQVGRCVYAEPCGCRLWQGKVPKAWA
jgi:hypothetical protein